MDKLNKIQKFIFFGLILFQILIIIFILPLSTKSFDDSYLQKLKFNFYSINYLKLPFFFIIFFLFAFIINFISNKTLFYISYIILSLSLYIFIPSHCPLNICFYSVSKSTNISNLKYINFFAIGDIQNIHFTKQSYHKWHNRIYATELYINSINIFIKKMKNKDLSNVNFNLTNDKKVLFFDIIKNDIQFLVNTGDITQSGNNYGRFGMRNDIGAYEYAFNNNPEDNGLLNIPSFEVLGNHDYDIEKKDPSFFDLIKNKLSFEGNPLINMQLRRIKKKKFVTDKDKYGNYALDINNLHIIFINVWPSKEKLLNGNPIGSIEFLKNNLEKNISKKWLLVTHYMPYVKKSFDELIIEDGIIKRYLEDFGNIYEKYKNNCLGVLYGHNHINKMNYYKLLDLHYYNLPGPASYLSKITETRETINKKNIEIPLFSFVKDKEILEKIRINIIKENNIYKFFISSY